MPRKDRPADPRLCGLAQRAQCRRLFRLRHPRALYRASAPVSAVPRAPSLARVRFVRPPLPARSGAAGPPHRPAGARPLGGSPPWVGPPARRAPPALGPCAWVNPDRVGSPPAPGLRPAKAVHGCGRPRGRPWPRPGAGRRPPLSARGAGLARAGAPRARVLGLRRRPFASDRDRPPPGFSPAWAGAGPFAYPRPASYWVPGSLFHHWGATLPLPSFRSLLLGRPAHSLSGLSAENVL